MGIQFGDGSNQLSQAHIVNADYFTFTGRTTISTTGSNTNKVNLWTFTYNKKIASSHLILLGVMQAYGDRSGAVAPFTIINGTHHMGGWSMQYNNHNYMKCFPIGFYDANNTSVTGNITCGFSFNAGNSSSGERPASIINPDNNDDSRLAGGTRSYCAVMEYEP
tara:strand:- start:529 stop:1020 length:492 start_codon:yes stop_codon:yes gene_type:complete